MNLKSPYFVFSYSLHFDSSFSNPADRGTLKGTKSKIQKKIIYMNEEYPVSEYDNPYCEQPIEY